MGSAFASSLSDVVLPAIISAQKSFGVSICCFLKLRVLASANHTANLPFHHHFCHQISPTLPVNSRRSDVHGTGNFHRRQLCNPLFESIADGFSSPRCLPQKTFSTSASERDFVILKRLNHKDWLTPKEVLNIVDSLRNPAAVITVLELYSNRKDYNPNEAFYISIVKKLAQARMFDAIEDLMQRIKLERKCHLSDEFFYNVIKVYGNMAGRINRAIETLFDMPRYNCWPSVKTFNFVLNLLVSAKLFDVVHEVYTKAPKLGVEIDACCLNILIKGLCGCGKLEAAYELLDEFPKIRA